MVYIAFQWGNGQFSFFNGVIRARVGYCGGTKSNPIYRCLGDHTEAIDMDFDPHMITYEFR
ncbi:peptide methionine sulfoxide reductase-like protein [Leptotrombidium deliense]|uniref:peptide-methionine (S)-S-oxide reductase n=1 Tax=Leptotrombidium deliense TaxID=299467 RepID=A0A443S0V5_9ACAR|nr:peptide methionine sulfoxide reductase-like protein [Leptotrombidium deliense]